jgi:aerobic-type carbon monoxide dehydrogenase small subunit (CoxS/CutS family)
MKQIFINGHPEPIEEDASLLVVLLNKGPYAQRLSVSGAHRSGICGMGICFECQVTVDGKVVRACQIGCRDGMEVWLDAR